MLNYWTNECVWIVFFFHLVQLQVLTPSSGFLDFAISMRPDYHEAIIDTIRHYGWEKIIYLYDSHDGKFPTINCSFSFWNKNRLFFCFNHKFKLTRLVSFEIENTFFFVNFFKLFAQNKFATFNGKYTIYSACIQQKERRSTFQILVNYLLSICFSIPKQFNLSDCMCGTIKLSKIASRIKWNNQNGWKWFLCVALVGRSVGRTVTNRNIDILTSYDQSVIFAQICCRILPPFRLKIRFAKPSYSVFPFAGFS